jgi:hypothetical protein
MLYFERLWIKIHGNAIKTDFLAPFVLVLVGTGGPIDQSNFILSDFLFWVPMGVSS